jgi:glucose-1-phosphate cytidylyltransferase
VKVVILCGGMGTRLREETEYRPKPMVEVGGRPILWHILKHYAHFGYQRFVLCLGYKGQIIKDYFLNYEAMNNDFTVCLGQMHSVAFHGSHREQDYHVTLADTGQDTMTGARVKAVQKYIGDDTFLATYGDGLSDVDISKVVEFHRAHGRMATVTTVRPVSRFGIVEIDGGNNITSFAEKPQVDGWVNAGFFVFNRGVFDYLSDSPDCVLEREPLERMARDGELMAYRHDGFFYAMDTYRDYLYLNEVWNQGVAPWSVWNRHQE